MAIGQRIKFFRNLCKLTQKELGVKLGFPNRAADVRVAQYESEKRIPKENLIKDMANIFGVSPLSIDVPDIDTYHGLMHTLFALEDIYGMTIESIDGKNYISFDRFDKSKYIIDDIDSWQKEHQKLLDGAITKEEYDNWRYTYPKVRADELKKALDNIRENDTKSE